jgi:hypothetical protein
VSRQNRKVGRGTPRENFSSMTESDVCAESGGLVGLKLVDPPSPIDAGSEGTVVKNNSENWLSRGGRGLFTLYRRW